MSHLTPICASNPRTDGQPWEPWEGNGPCQDCGARNIVWLTPNSVWNTVMQDAGGLLCPSCFAVRAFAAGYQYTWMLRPESDSSNADYWFARRDEREALRREGFLVGDPPPLPVGVSS